MRVSAKDTTAIEAPGRSGSENSFRPMERTTMAKRRSSRRAKAPALSHRTLASSLRKRRAAIVGADALHHQQSVLGKPRRTKHAGVASGRKPSFRADKPRRAGGGSSQTAPIAGQSMADTFADPTRDPPNGIRDIALGDAYATKALVQAALAGLALRGALNTGIVDPRTIAGLPMAGRAIDNSQQASKYWSTPEAQETLSEIYSGPTGGLTP
jgi:hypothetical protein